MRILVLDDDDVRHERFKDYFRGHEVSHVYTVDGAITALIGDPVFDFAFLDHDLNDYHHKSLHNDGGYGKVELNGVDVASFIARILDVEKRPREVVVHSWNPAGARSMINILRDASIKTHQWVFDSSKSPLT